MRKVEKGLEPTTFTEWKAKSKAGSCYNYGSLDSSTRSAIRASLVAEQRGLCAYTGRRISMTTCHIEHLRPQKHCVNGQDIDYSNIVACVPAPNQPKLEYGAHKKDDWPSPVEASNFVSPLAPNCESRFKFNLRGEIFSANTGDLAAEETIDRLNLNNKTLVGYRKSAIDALLEVRGQGPGALDAAKARNLLSSMTSSEQVNGSVLRPFCFALKQALNLHITRVEAIRANKKAQRKIGANL